jgi:hypothetical protein
LCDGVEWVFGDRGKQQRLFDETLETGVSTRQPIAWIDLGVDERKDEKWILGSGEWAYDVRSPPWLHGKL